MKINPSLVCERVGDDVVVLDSEHSTVVTLTGDRANVVAQLLMGTSVHRSMPGVAELVKQGVLLDEEGNLSRRTLVTTGAVIGAGGVVAMSLPATANASSQTITELTADGSYEFKNLNEGQNYTFWVELSELPDDFPDPDSGVLTVDSREGAYQPSVSTRYEWIVTYPQEALVIGGDKEGILLVGTYRVTVTFSEVLDD